jgi:hypothetical protein
MKNVNFVMEQSMPSSFEGPSDGLPEVSGPDSDAGVPLDMMTDDEIVRAAALRERREAAQVKLNYLFGSAYAEPEPGVGCVDVPVGGNRLPYRIYMN